jgi:hypothetical protein
MRSFYLKSLVCMALLLAMRSEDLLSAQEKAPVPVTIKIVDQSGAAIPGAAIKLDPSPADLPAESHADGNGVLAIGLSRGSYRVSVDSSGFFSLTKEIEVRDSKAQIFQLSLRVWSCPPGPCITVLTSPSINPEISAVSAVLPEDRATASLTITAGQKSKTIDIDALKSLPHKTVTVHNPHANADENYSGVELIDLLVSLGVPHGKDLHGKALAEYVVATGSDGYKAVLALAEVDPEFHPGEVIVADTMDGKPLDAKTGPFRLVVTEDKRPARSVHSLVSIEVKQAE